ncbi:GNAT family N-acetyltransferase [Anianabacter salinae]|uniref:GNAT family N-acetyltransferase n=1 Tax=Anianabacter salinae TaxID=2851023 RepID=UPI00225E4D43|nr:GNAT family protein [Anianabacter salinae]MBV0911951.1 GNAT family N-acetyltransferase [Anianabacter salinae]
MLTEPTVEQMTIEAARFDLRPVRASDRGLLDLYASDRRVAEMTRSIPHPLPPGSSEAFLRRAHAPDRDEDVWAMDGTKSNLSELLGLIALERMDRDQCEVGYWVAPAFWNTHIASEAVEAIIAANPLGAKTMFASVFQDNAVSARVLTNAGFEYIGDAEAFSVARNAKVATWTYIRKL